MRCNRSKSSVMLLQPSKTYGSVKVIMNPADGNTVARGKSECPKCSGMVSTFITQISTVTVRRAVACVGRKSWFVDMRAPAAHVCGLGSCRDKHQRRAQNHNRHTIAHLGPPDDVDQEKTMLQSWQPSQQCCWSVPEKAR